MKRMAGDPVEDRGGTSLVVTIHHLASNQRYLVEQKAKVETTSDPSYPVKRLS